MALKTDIAVTSRTARQITALTVALKNLNPLFKNTTQVQVPNATCPAESAASSSINPFTTDPVKSLHFAILV